MNNFDNIRKNMSFHEFAQWLKEYCDNDEAPWRTWFNDTYCAECPGEIVQYTYKGGQVHECPCTWCEVHDKCYFFQDSDVKRPPSILNMIEMWLRAEVENNNKDIFDDYNIALNG